MSDETAISEGFIQDFITGNQIKDTAEEFVRQDIAKVLFHEYGFRVEDMEPDYSITYQTEVGATKRRKIDIAIFPTGITDHSDQNRIIRLIQVEAPGTSGNHATKGTDALKDLMIACKDCEFGLWSNGTTERYALMRIEKTFEWSFEEIIDIPGAGQTLDDVDSFDKDSLKIATGRSLLHTFKRCHNYIAANQGIKKDQAFWELLKLIFCKIHDERTPDLRFRAASSERNSMDGQQRVSARIKKLFDEVKATYSHIFREGDELALNPRVVAYIVSQLQQYDLLRSPVDVKGTAYEEIVGDNLKGDKGQFFTPRNVIRMAVRMMIPTEDQRILDPACGTGGFLVEALTYVIDQVRNEDPDNSLNRIEEFSTTQIFGVDFDPDLVKATQMNMVMNNDGQGHLFSVNTLDNPYNWPDNVREELQFEKFDLILTNPPFGSKLEIDDPNILKMYELARKWEHRSDGSWWPTGNLQSKLPPEILFIERCWHFLKPGSGRMGIVLPDGILSNPDLEYVRAWILRNCRVLASIDLPVETFLPHTGTQTSMLFLQRKPKSAGLHAHISGQEDSYPIFMAIAEKVGKDRRANPIYRRDPYGNELWFDATEEEEIWVDELADSQSKAVDDPNQILIERNGVRYIRYRQIHQVTRQVKQLDDDLPLIAESYRRFVAEHSRED